MRLGQWGVQYTVLLIHFDQSPEKTEGVLGLNFISLVSLSGKNWQRLCQTSEKNTASMFDNSSDC